MAPGCFSIVDPRPSTASVTAHPGEAVYWCCQWEQALLSHQRQTLLGVQAYVTDAPPPKRAGQLLPKSQSLSTLSAVSAPRLPKLKV